MWSPGVTTVSDQREGRAESVTGIGRALPEVIPWHAQGSRPDASDRKVTADAIEGQASLFRVPCQRQHSHCVLISGNLTPCTHSALTVLGSLGHRSQGHT